MPIAMPTRLEQTDTGISYNTNPTPAPGVTEPVYQERTFDSGPTAPAPSTYTVSAGDTFYAIARKLGINAAELIAANAGVDPSSLQIGQSVNLPGVMPDIQRSGVVGSMPPPAPIYQDTNGGGDPDIDTAAFMANSQIPAPGQTEPMYQERVMSGSPTPVVTPTTPTRTEPAYVAPNTVKTTPTGGATSGAAGGSVPAATTPSTSGFKGILVNGAYKMGDDIVTDITTSDFLWDPAGDKNYQMAAEDVKMQVMNTFNRAGMVNSSLTQKAMTNQLFKLEGQYYELAYQKFKENRDFMMGLAELAYSREDRAWDNEFNMLQFQAQRQDEEFDREMARRNDARQEASLSLQRAAVEAQQEANGLAADLEYGAAKYDVDYKEYQAAVEEWENSGSAGASAKTAEIMNQFGGNVYEGQSFANYETAIAIDYADQHFASAKNSLFQLADYLDNAEYMKGALYNYLTPEEEVDYAKANPSDLGRPDQYARFVEAQNALVGTNTVESAQQMLVLTAKSEEAQKAMGYDLYKKLLWWTENEYIPNFYTYHPVALTTAGSTTKVTHNMPVDISRK